MSTEQAELHSNEEAVIAANYISDESSSSGDSQTCLDIGDDFSNICAKEPETSDDLNNTNEYQDVECRDNFLSSLEQIAGNDCSMLKLSSHDNHLKPSHDDELYSENVIVPCKDTKPSRLVLIEEIQEKTTDKIIEQNITDLSDKLNEEFYVFEKENSEISEFNLEKEIDKIKDTDANETNPKGNSMKITFYCESVNKLMSDCVGEECDELIQEITPTVDNSI